MKISLIILFSLVLAKSEISLAQAVGHNCGETNIYEIQSLNILPWPATAGMTATLLLSGKFLKNVLIQELILGTCINNMIWNYEAYDIEQNFEAGEIVTFPIGAVFPTEKASYTSTVQLVAGDQICCWQFSYNID